MKKRITALMTVAALACGSLLACGTASTTSYASETIYGEVTAVSDSGFTMTVGTYADNELTLGSESVDITVTDDTTYSMSMSGGDQGQPGGEAPSGEATEKPEGEEPSADGEAPEQLEGEAPSGDGEAPEKPEGEEPSADGESTEQPSGEAPSGEAPEKPEGDEPSGGAPGEMELSLSSISVGTQVAVTFDSKGNVESVEIIAGM